MLLISPLPARVLGHVEESISRTPLELERVAISINGTKLSVLIIFLFQPSGHYVPMLSMIRKEVVYISLPEKFSDGYNVPLGSVRIRNQITSKGCSSDREELGSLLNLTGTPFYVSNKNTLIVVGCNNTASLTNTEPRLVGCTSSCNKKERTPTEDYLATLTCKNKYGPYYNEVYCGERGNMTYTSCNGNRCCTADMPNIIQQVMGVRIDNTSTSTGGCKVAFVTDEAYSVVNGSDPKQFHAKQFATVELGWFIHTTNRSFVKSLGCYSSQQYEYLSGEELFKYSCLCDDYSSLSYARCACNKGYEGNPYIPGDCKDINECLLNGIDGSLMYSCEAGKKCVNILGHYKCVDTYVRTFAMIIGMSISGSFIFIGGIYLLHKLIRNLNKKKRFFKRNGGLLLQQQLTSTEGNVEKTRVFSSKELEKATENFSLNRILGQGGQGTVYKGMLVDGTIVAVKKSKVVDEDNLEEFINEVVILSQINHRNIVKLFGCCLATNVPVLVYEFIPNGNLFEHLHDEFDDNTMFTWDVRLRIAVDIAGALSYLHSSASSPVYHRDIKSSNIMLDEKYRAKVSDFGTSRSVTADHTHLTTVVSGTMGYLDPEYFQTSQFTDKSDVYSFGVVLVELITGEKSISFLRFLENRTLATYFVTALKENRLFDIIDARIKGSCKLNQVTAVAKIARKCLNPKGKKRPSMREVSMELEKIRATSVDMLPDEYASENENDKDSRVVETNIAVEAWNNVSVTAPASQYNAATSSLSSSDIEPLFPLQTR